MADSSGVAAKTEVSFEEQLQEILEHVKETERVDFLKYVLTADASSGFEARLEADAALRGWVKQAARIISTSVVPFAKTEGLPLAARTSR